MEDGRKCVHLEHNATVGRDLDLVGKIRDAHFESLLDAVEQLDVFGRRKERDSKTLRPETPSATNLDFSRPAALQKT